MYRFLAFLLSVISFVSSLSSAPEVRSYEYMSENLWTDHVKHMNKLFELTKITSFLEFGVGEGTQYYLENCEEVTSIELLDSKNAEASEQCYNQYLDLYSTATNWHPILHRCTKAIDDAVAVAELQNINPITVNSAYQLEIESICDSLFKNKTYDVVFVDTRVIVRGSIVNEIFGRADIIVAHDVCNHPTIYGWEWVNTPDDYERIRFMEGSGTAFWIKKTRSDIIEGLKKYPHYP